MDSSTGTRLRNVADLVRRAAGRDPERPALIDGDTTMTWGEFDDRVDAAAAALGPLGFAPGDRVAIAMPPGLEAPVLYFGVLRAGLVVVPVDPAAGAELLHPLADSGAAALIGGPAATRAVRTVADRLPALRHVLRAGEPGFAALTAAAPPGPVEAVGHGDDLAVLMYTAGTSGRPRGAMLPHRALLANLAQCAEVAQGLLDADTVALLAQPMHHIYGFATGLLQVAWHGCTAVLAGTDAPADTLALVARHRVTAVPGSPSMFTGWAADIDANPATAAALRTVAVAVSGGAALPARVGAELGAAGLPVHEGYGCTEAAPVVTSTLVPPVTGRAGAGVIGRPLPGIELRLVDPATGSLPVDLPVDLYDEIDAPGGDIGELAVRGPNLFTGYWPDGADGPGPDGWWPTGDLAVLDADGELILVGRRADTVCTSGFTVHAAEVEAVLEAHGRVREAAVVGVPDPDRGELVKAFVTLRADPGGSAERPAPAADEIRAHCRRSLARFKCPAEIVVVPELPHSASGKLRRAPLRSSWVG